MKTPEQVVLDAAAETGRQFAPPAAEPKSELQEQIDNAAEAAIEMEVPKVDGYGGMQKRQHLRPVMPKPPVSRPKTQRRILPMLRAQIHPLTL